MLHDFLWVIAQANQADAWREDLNLISKGFWVILTIFFACLAVAYYFLGQIGRICIAILATAALLVMVEPKLTTETVEALNFHEAALFSGEATSATVMFYSLIFALLVLFIVLGFVIAQRFQQKSVTDRSVRYDR